MKLIQRTTRRWWRKSRINFVVRIFLVMEMFYSRFCMRSECNQSEMKVFCFEFGVNLILNDVRRFIRWCAVSKGMLGERNEIRLSLVSMVLIISDLFKQDSDPMSVHVTSLTANHMCDAYPPSKHINEL